jgi:hypothetical protein
VSIESSVLVEAWDNPQVVAVFWETKIESAIMVLQE